MIYDSVSAPGEMFGQVGAQAALADVFYDCAAPSSPTMKRKKLASYLHLSRC